MTRHWIRSAANALLLMNAASCSATAIIAVLANNDRVFTIGLVTTVSTKQNLDKITLRYSTKQFWIRALVNRIYHGDVITFPI